MREIKFRAWDKENKKMLMVENLHFDEYRNNEMSVRTTMYTDYFTPEEMILMQFTRLHDKNGKEIYEGDIISNGPERCIVVWVKEYAGFMLKLINKEYEDKEWTNPMIDLRNDEEVIGNIYENPGLLKGADNIE